MEGRGREHPSGNHVKARRMAFPLGICFLAHIPSLLAASVCKPQTPSTLWTLPSPPQSTTTTRRRKLTVAPIVCMCVWNKPIKAIKDCERGPWAARGYERKGCCCVFCGPSHRSSAKIPRALMKKCDQRGIRLSPSPSILRRGGRTNGKNGNPLSPHTHLYISSS